MLKIITACIILVSVMIADEATDIMKKQSSIVEDYNPHIIKKRVH